MCILTADGVSFISLMVLEYRVWIFARTSLIKFYENHALDTGHGNLRTRIVCTCIYSGCVWVFILYIIHMFIHSPSLQCHLWMKLIFHCSGDMTFEPSFLSSFCMALTGMNLSVNFWKCCNLISTFPPVYMPSTTLICGLLLKPMISHFLGNLSVKTELRSWRQCHVFVRTKWQSKLFVMGLRSGQVWTM